MKLFARKKEQTASCGCGCDAKTENVATNARVKVLGSGCAKCNELESNTRAALAELSMDTAIDHITDFAQIAAYGVMSTPALVLNGKVVSYGRVLGKNEIIPLLQENL